MKIDGEGKMTSWRNYFDKINEEYAVMMRKKQALSSLANSGKISQFTFDLFDKEIDVAIAEIEKQKNVLLEKMNAKTKELEENIKVLEKLLANFEIQHVGGEIDEEVYQREMALLSIGIETARQELCAVKEAIDKIANAPRISESVAAPAPTEGETKLQESTTENIETGKLETAEVEAKTESTESIEPQKIETAEVEAKTETQELAETPQETAVPSETPQMETPSTEAPPIETPQTETPPLETPQVEKPLEEGSKES